MVHEAVAPGDEAEGESGDKGERGEEKHLASRDAEVRRGDELCHSGVLHRGIQDQHPQVADGHREIPMLVGLIELIPDEGGDARFDAARPERDQAEPGVEARPVRLEERKAQVARAKSQAEPEDGVVFAEESIGEPAAEQRKK